MFKTTCSILQINLGNHKVEQEFRTGCGCGLGSTSWSRALALRWDLFQGSIQRGCWSLVFSSLHRYMVAWDQGTLLLFLCFPKGREAEPGAAGVLGSLLRSCCTSSVSTRLVQPSRWGQRPGCWYPSFCHQLFQHLVCMTLLFGISLSACCPGDELYGVGTTSSSK